MIVFTILGWATAGDYLTYVETDLPTTLNPLYAASLADRRVHELIFDRLFYRSAIS
jgi:hypothetical protein